MKRFPIAVLALRRGGKAPLAVWFALCALAVNPAVVFAQAGNVTQLTNSTAVSISTASPAQIEDYWTPERMRNAKPVVAQPASVDVNGYPTAAQGPIDRSPSVVFAGAAPTVSLRASDAKVLIPGLQDIDTLSVIPTLTSSYKAHFTTSRVFPDAAVSTYPNLAAGKLFFRDQGAGTDNVCTASVIRHRLVVTAGHCVAKPSTNPNQRYFYTNFKYVPAYRNGVAPAGEWFYRAVWTTATWITSNGSFPNAQDVAILVMLDNGGQRIGNVTGFLGWAINKLSPNHITSIGYPVNLDNGQRMEINNSQIIKSGGNNTFIIGSAMRGGSSGGPWIMNYGVAPTSNPAIAGMGANTVVSVTSYGPVATEPKYQGGSSLNSQFTSLYNAACATAPSAGNCN